MLVRQRGMSPKVAAKIWKPETNLKKMRIKKGLSQNELAIASGIRKGTIQCYENNSRNIDNAKLEMLCDLCMALGCKIEDLLEDKKLKAKYKNVK